MQAAGPSITAQRVAAHRLSFPRLGLTTGRPDDDDALARDVAAGVEVREGRMHRHLLARTAFFDAVVVAALGRGTDQVVLLGAGYDGRSLRFGGSGARWYEVDRAATQADKRERLERLGIATTDVTYVTADFATDDTGAALVAAGLDATRPSLLVLEGVAPYLEDAVLESLLVSVRAVAAPESRLAMSLTVARDPDDAEAVARAAAFREAVAALGEPLRTSLGDHDVDPLLARTRWRRVNDEPIAIDDVRNVDGRRHGLVLAEPAGPLP